MAVRPDILLLDEPFSALDPATRHSLQVWLRDAAAALGLTLVMVTHDVDEALYLATEVTLLDGSGRAAGHCHSDAPADHDDLARHPLRATLLAGYRSQLGAAAAS